MLTIAPVKYKVWSSKKQFAYFIERIALNEVGEMWFITVSGDKRLDFHMSTFTEFKGGFGTLAKARDELAKYLGDQFGYSI